MKALLAILGILLLSPLVCAAQSPLYGEPTVIILVSSVPSGSCTAGSPNRQVMLTGVQYACQNIAAGVGAWGQATPSGGKPTFTLGAGAGTGAVFSYVGSDSYGVVTLTSGTSPTNGGVIFTVTRANSCESGTSPQVRSANANAAQLIGTTHDYVNPISSSQWSLVANATGITASTLYKWAYHDGCY